MAYRVVLTDDVAAIVSGFDPEDAHYWRVFVEIVGEDPFDRNGRYSEQFVGVKGFPVYTHIYWIEQAESAGGERVFVFTAEFFDYRPVYVIDEKQLEIEVFAIRERWIYDPL